MSRLLKQVIAQVSKTVPLQTVLIVPFVLQTLVTVGLVGYFSFRNGQTAVNDLASQVRRELAKQIEGKLQTYTTIPHNINRLNASTFAQGRIDVNAARDEFPLWQQIQIYPTVSDIYCADRSGSFLGVRRIPADQSIELRSSNAATGHKIYGYSLDRNGQRSQLVSQDKKSFDAHVRPWYKAAVAAGEPVWSEIYADFATQLPTLTASTPVFSTADHSLLGVCATDVFLPNEMSGFLSRLKIGKTGSAFILERSGRLVSTSTEEATMSSGAAAERLPAVESRNPTVRATASYLRSHFSDLRQIQSVEQFDFNLDGKRQLVQVMPFKGTYGLDWLIVTVLPESDFMGQIDQNTRTAMLLCSAALILGIIICILTARWITQPIVSVSRSAKALARGEWERTVEVKRSGDLGELASSFNQMARQIRTSFAAMQSLNEALSQSESRLKQFLEAVPVGIAMLDASGRPYYTNERATQILGMGAIPSVTLEQIPEFYEIYVAGTNRLYPAEALSLIRALKGERTTADNLELHQGNKIISLETWGTPVFDEDGNVAYAIAAFQDITERKQAEQLLANYNRTLEQQVAQRTAALQQSEAELREQEQELRLITDALPAVICYVDANRRYQFINRTYEAWFSRSRDEILGKYMHECARPVYQILEPHVNRVFEGQTVTFEAEISLSLGKRYISATLIPDCDCQSRVRGFYGLIADIGDRKRAEEASILEERNRMAREIHDTLAQSFTGIVIHARAAAGKIAVNPEKAHASLAQVQNLARTGLDGARRSVEALRRPCFLEKHDLLNALKHLATKLEPSTGTIITCEAIGRPYPLPSEVENNLFRMGQEAITNALKYAQATEIRVELTYQSRQCTLRVQDDGQGFNIERCSRHHGFGLLGMAERAERMGAQLQLRSAPGRGTEIMVSVNQEQLS